jgi:hypothetical protein
MLAHGLVKSWNACLYILINIMTSHVRTPARLLAHTPAFHTRHWSICQNNIVLVYSYNIDHLHSHICARRSAGTKSCEKMEWMLVLNNSHYFTSPRTSTIGGTSVCFQNTETRNLCKKHPVMSYSYNVAQLHRHARQQPCWCVDLWTNGMHACT